MHVIMNMVLPIYHDCRVLFFIRSDMKMKSQEDNFNAIEFLVEFCTVWYPRLCYDYQYFSQNDDLNVFDELVMVVS